jgi:hypothetical protein
MEAATDCALAWTPVAETEARTVVELAVLRLNTSSTPFVSPATRFVADDRKAIRSPVLLIDGERDVPFPITPAVLRESKTVVDACVSRRKTSVTALVSPVTKFVAAEEKAIRVPRLLIATSDAPPFAWTPPFEIDTRVVAPVSKL